MTPSTVTYDSSTRPRWRRIRLWLLPAALAIVAGVWWIRTHDPSTLGRSDALAAIRGGELVMLLPPNVTFSPAPGCIDESRILRDRYNIVRRQGYNEDYVQAYNEVMLDEIERRFGAGIWKKVEEEAIQGSQLEQTASGKVVPPN